MSEIIFNQLSALVSGLSQDTGINVCLGENWSYNASSKTLTVCSHTLETEGIDYCAAVVTHECGHYYLSRYPLFKGTVISSTITGLVLNALEDPRVNLWMQGRYPGTAPWFIKMHERDMHSLGPRGQSRRFTRLLEFTLGCASLDHMPQESAQALSAIQEEVKTALAETHQARHRYATTTPPFNLSVDDARAETDAFRSHVIPSMSPAIGSVSQYTWHWTARDIATVNAAFDAFTIAQQEVFPVVEHLHELDRQTVAAYIASEKSRLRQARQAFKDDDFTLISEIVFGSFEKPEKYPTPPSNPTGDHLANAVLEKFYEHIDRARKSHSSGPYAMVRAVSDTNNSAGLPMHKGNPHSSSPGSPAPSGLNRDQVNYARLERLARRQVALLTSELEDVLQPRKRMRYQDGYASGQVVNMRRLLAYEADPQKYDQMWRRKISADRHKTAASLLIDLSGSMNGDKAQAAYVGTLLFAQTLENLSIPFAIHGFQDELIPFHQFGETFSHIRKTELRGIVEEAANCRPNGLNHAYCNDDGPCLEDASEQLLDYAADDRLMIVISDGQPAGSRSTEQDLKDVIAKLSADVVPLHLIGLGLGEDTEHVSDYYPNAISNIPIENLAKEIGVLLKGYLCSAP